MAATGGAGTAAATGGGGAATAASFVFKDPSVYASFKVDTDENGFPIVNLPVGAKVFRADLPVATVPRTDIPAFFSNLESIEPYTKFHEGLTNRDGKEIKESNMRETRSAYTVTKSPRLFHMTFDSLVKLKQTFEKIVKEKSLLRYKEYLFAKYAFEVLSDYILEETKAIAPLLPLRTTIVIPKPIEKYQLPGLKYLNRYIAEIICERGYDGWIVKPFNPEKSEGLKEYSEFQLAKFCEEFQILPEILLNPEELHNDKYKKYRAIIIEKILEAYNKLFNIDIDITTINLSDLEEIIKSIEEVASHRNYVPEIMLCNWSAFMEPASLEGGGRRRRAKTRRQRQRHRRTHRK